MRPATLTRQMCAVVAAGALVTGPATPVAAATLQPRTARAFDEYARAVEERARRERRSGRGFLGMDFQDSRAALAARRAVTSGAVPVWRLAEQGHDAREIDIPGGLINHWRGAILVPHVTLDQVLVELRSPQARRHIQDDVLESREVWRNGDESHVFLKLVRKKIVTVTYSTEHTVRYLRLSPTQAWSQSVSTRIAEIEGAGTPSEREKPVGQDRGFMWRLHSYWRYEQVPEGVIVELESLTLSRDLPLVVSFIARPIIESVARESMTRTLESVRERLAAGVAVRGTSSYGPAV